MNRVINVARTWIGTPYMHQAAVRGAGTDCLGLIRGVWREVIGIEPETIPPYSVDWNEPQRDEGLWRAAERWLIPIPTIAASEIGQVALFRMRDGCVAKHLGILSRNGSGPTFVHAYVGCGVVETSLSEPWRRRIVARFAFPIDQED
jgi:NlpC/P60 family putative phage cell wall peptidase